LRKKLSLLLIRHNDTVGAAGAINPWWVVDLRQMQQLSEPNREAGREGHWLLSNWFSSSF
jgi:hypothetical protein